VLHISAFASLCKRQPTIIIHFIDNLLNSNAGFDRRTYLVHEASIGEVSVGGGASVASSQ
jgi:hypothetical protein